MKTNYSQIRSYHIFYFLIILTLISTSALAQTVTMVKGQKALIDLQGTSVKAEDEFFTLNAAGKKIGIIKIRTIKGGKATADILKGKVEVGNSLQSRGGGSAHATSSGDSSGSTQDTSSGSSPSALRKSETWGILGSFGMDKMDASFTNSSVKYTTNMQGTGFGLLGFYDHPMTKDFILRGTAGIEQFISNGTLTTAVCGNGTSNDCSVNIMYLSFYGTAKYILVGGKAKLWLGGGLGYLFAASKSSNVLKTDGLSTYVIVPSLGVDIPIGAGFLPIVFDYTLYPDSADVKASAMSIRAGWGWYF